MERIIDIRPIKKQLRADCKKSRKELDKKRKELLDKKINAKLLNLWATREAKTVLVYISTEIEVDTRPFINELFSRGKRVGAPRCENLDGDMSFYTIRSYEDLESGSFSLLEPNTQKCERLTDFENCICLVPAFMFDKNGYRLGYGKGFYDRFLADFHGITIGVCYDFEITDSLYHGKFDRAVDMIVTDKQIIDTRTENP